MKVRLALALCWGLATAVALYAIVRAVQYFRFPDPNPALVVWSAHAGFFWRAWIVAYGGGIAAFVIFFVCRSAAAGPKLAHALGPAVVTSAVLLALQSLILP